MLALYTIGDLILPNSITPPMVVRSTNIRTTDRFLRKCQVTAFLDIFASAVRDYITHGKKRCISGILNWE